MSLPDLNPKVVLGVAAHPDDLDFHMGGSVAAWTKQGVTVYYLILTNGNKGASDDTSPEELLKQRQAEQRQAADILGVKEVFFCDYNDCELHCDDNVKCDIARIIRKVNPDVVMTIDPTMVYNAEYGIVNHTDHRAAGQATIDAVYPLARDHLAFPMLIEEGLEPHKVSTLLLSNFDKNNYCVDITATLDLKLKALAAHNSQFDAKPEIADLVRTINHKDGQTIGSAYGEAFVRIDIA